MANKGAEGEASADPAGAVDAPIWAQASPPTGDALDSATISIQNKSTRRSLVLVPRLTWRAFKIVWQAARWTTALSLSLILLNSLLTVAQVIAAKWVLSAVLSNPRGGVAALWPSVVTLAALSAGSLVLRSASGQLRRLVTQLVGRETGREILEVATALPLIAYEHPGFFDHLRRVESNALTRPSDIVDGVAVMLSSLVTTIGLVAVIATTEPIVLPMLALAIAPTYLANRAASRLEFALTVEQMPRLRERDYLRMLLESRDTAKEIRAYATADILLHWWSARWAEYLRAFRDVVRSRVSFSLIGALSSSVVLGGTLLILAMRVRTGESLATVATALVAVRMLASQLQGTTGGLNGLFESRLFLEDYEKFLSYRPAARCSQPEVPADTFQHLELRNVSFTYPGSSRPAVDDISLDIRAGEVIALVGENGSGKTTLAKILANLYAPTSGTVCWNGTETSSLDPAAIRSQVGVIFQDFLKYALSAADNIGLGRPEQELDMRRVEAAAAQADVSSFIETLPDGYDTRLGKMWAGSVDLSIGQWQRLALARMFYRDAQLIVLDEPTSALDARAEAEFFNRLRAVFAGRTIVLISHRFSTVRSADRIVVLERGLIVENGTHDNLMEAGGLYSELFALQALPYIGAANV